MLFTPTNLNPERLNMTLQAVKDPWETVSCIPTNRNLFYFVSSDFNESGVVNSCVWVGAELKDKMCYTNPLVAALVDPLFNKWSKNQKIWLVSGTSKDGTTSLFGRSVIGNLKVISKTEFKLSLEDAFKLAGAAIIKIHEDKQFLAWFLDSLGARSCQSETNLGMSKISRKIADRYADSDLGKNQEFLAVANLAESKEGKEEEWFFRRKMAISFVYSISSADIKGKRINIDELCERALVVSTKNPETIKDAF